MSIYSFQQTPLWWSENPINSRFTFDSLWGQSVNEVKEIVQNFRSSRDFFERNALPYALNLVLEGPHGSGKTTMVQAIANFLQRDIIHIPYSRNPFDVERFLESFERKESIVSGADIVQKSLPDIGNAVLVIEDDQSSAGHLMQDFLNRQIPGRVTIMTSLGRPLFNLQNATNIVLKPPTKEEVIAKLNAIYGEGTADEINAMTGPNNIRVGEIMSLVAANPRNPFPVVKYISDQGKCFDTITPLNVPDKKQHPIFDVIDKSLGSHGTCISAPSANCVISNEPAPLTYVDKSGKTYTIDNDDENDLLVLKENPFFDGAPCPYEEEEVVV